MAGNNGENVDNGESVEHVVVNIGLNLEDGIDPSKVTEYLEKLFRIGDKLNYYIMRN